MFSTLEPAHREKSIGGHGEKLAACKPRREVSGEIRPVDTLILDFKLLVL